MLLPLAGRPMLDYLLDRIREVEDVEEIHVVTNSRFAPTFRDWAPADVTVHDDGTTSNEDRLGAIGDLAFTIERAGLEGEDLLVVAGDNLVGYSLPEFVGFWREKGGSAIAVYEVADARAPQEVWGDRARRRRPGRRLRGETRPSAEQSRRDGRVSLPRAGSRSCLRGTWTKATRRMRRGTSSPGCTREPRCTGTASPASGTTSAMPASCWRRTTACENRPACPFAASTPSINRRRNAKI